MELHSFQEKTVEVLGVTRATDSTYLGRAVRKYNLYNYDKKPSNHNGYWAIINNEEAISSYELHLQQGDAWTMDQSNVSTFSNEGIPA